MPEHKWGTRPRARLSDRSVSQQNPAGPAESNTENETSGTLISSGDQSAEDPGLCALFVESHATGGETP